MASRDLSEQIKVGLAAATFIGIGVSAILARLRAKAKDNEAAREYLANTPVVSIGRYSFNAAQTFVAALMFLALMGTINYAEYDRRLVFEKYDHYDLLHYYINAKYFDELGYFNLLPAILVADREAGEYCPGKAPVYLAQDENDYVRRPIEHAYAREKEIKALFTEERWEAFFQDTIYVQRYNSWMHCRLWRQLLQDHGFNGTPVWVLIARPITNMIPVNYIKYATSLDLLWLIAMLYLVAWAFGKRTMLFAWIFITICYSFRWPTLSWAFLRYDWVSAMVIGVCMVKKEKWYWAGLFFAYATLMRYFPAAWLLGIVAKGIHGVITRRDIPLSRIWQRVPSRYWKMFAGFACTVLILGSMSVARDGIESHKQSMENILAHVQPHNLSSRRQGLVIPLTYRGETEQKLITPEKKQMVAAIEKQVRGFSIIAIIVLALFMTRLKDWEVVCLGAIPYFWLTTSSYYYYVMRLTLILFHAKDLTKTRNIVGLSLLIGIELFCNASQHINPGNRYFLICWMGIMLIAYTGSMMGFLGYEWWKGRGKPLPE
jgi:hypothetical protein